MQDEINSILLHLLFVQWPSEGVQDKSGLAHFSHCDLWSRRLNTVHGIVGVAIVTVERHFDLVSGLDHDDFIRGWADVGYQQRVEYWTGWEKRRVRRVLESSSFRRMSSTSFLRPGSSWQR